MFADQIYSPAAQALLLHGVWYATRDILGEQDEGFVVNILREIVLKQATASEARNYAACINFGLTPAALERENVVASRPIHKPSAVARRGQGSHP